MTTKSAAVPSTTALQEFLLQLGTHEVPHSGRTLYEHLCGVSAILRGWEQPEELCKAGMFHSIYSTEKFAHQTLSIDERSRLKEAIGEQAEHLAYLFATVSRTAVLDAANSGISLSPSVTVELPRHATGESFERATGAEIAHLVLLDFANRLEQANSADGIGFWLARMSEDVRCLQRYSAPLPDALQALEGTMLADEQQLHSLYLQGVTLLQIGDAPGALTHLENACRLVPAVGEPHLMRACAYQVLGDFQSARQAAAIGLRTLRNWGVPWHKGLSMQDWCRLAELIQSNSPATEVMELVRSASSACRKPAAAGAHRFFSYLKAVRTSDSRGFSGYPGLSRRSWYDPEEFPVARELESRFAEIKEEALNVKPGCYYEEAENIERTGSWQVCMLYEQGRRNEFVCEQCPITTSILDTSKLVRRSAGLIYFSKMAPHTRVAAHQGRTNVRVRCHLALDIPEGDCAMRVGDRVHHWTEGKCIVFDDTFEHEVWNHTDEERLVLLVDLWHPDLTDLEREALDSINRLSMYNAQKMSRAWERNDGQREREGKILASSSKNSQKGVSKSNSPMLSRNKN